MRWSLEKTFVYVCVFDTIMYLIYFKMLKHIMFLIAKHRSNCAAETATKSFLQ